MDPATPVTIAKGAVLTSIAAGTMTAFIALCHGSRHPAPLAMSSAVNGGIAGTMFFSFREVLVGPLLRATLQPSVPVPATEATSSKPSWAHIRLHNVPDSMISGACTGAIIKAWQRSFGSIWAGARTAAIICMGLQLGYNELGIMRVKIVSRKLRPPQDAPPMSSPPQESPEKPRITWFDRFMSVIGFHKLSDEEYLGVLKKQRHEALERIAVLEQERKEKRQLDDEESRT